MTVNTTFLPKTNGLVFSARLHARSDKGRVFGFGQDLVINFGVNWVTPEPFLVSEDVVATTANWLHAEAGDIYRFRLQTRPEGNSTITNLGWTTYDGTRQDVTVTLPADDTIQVRFHCQGKDQGTGAAINSFTGWRSLSSPTPPETP